MFDSLDVRRTDDAQHLAYQEANRKAGRYFGEIRIQFEYKGKPGPLFGWLHVDPQTLADRAGVWERLRAIEADPGRYPEPVRWLPELARYACGRTGNPILDCELDPGGQGPWFSWAADLEQVRHGARCS